MSDTGSADDVRSTNMKIHLVVSLSESAAAILREIILGGQKDSGAGAGSSSHALTATASVQAPVSRNGTTLAIPADRPPAVDPRESVQPDHLVCLEDGVSVVLLKRYIKTRFNLTPDQYRKRWGLPADYPMVAPNYAKKRSMVAIRTGLGQKGRGRKAKEEGGVTEAADSGE